MTFLFKCRKNTESENPKYFYQNVQCVIVKNRNFLNNKKLEDYGMIWFHFQGVKEAILSDSPILNECNSKQTFMI